MNTWDHMIRMWACVSGYVCWYWQIFPSFPNPLVLAKIGLSPPVSQRGLLPHTTHLCLSPTPNLTLLRFLIILRVTQVPTLRSLFSPA